ncbi:MAG: carbohydrate kinase [Rhodothermaceae bacterium]|nr:MAG: carbohydrate kinase [Rhodothermaceae bacterium]
MTPTHYLAVDLGASSGRVFLGTLEGDVMHMEALHRFETPLLERDGHLYWDAEALVREVEQGLRRGLDAAPDLRSVAVDSWAVDYVPLDRDGQPLRRPYAYRDRRTDGLMQKAFRTMPAAELFAHTGIQFLPFNTLYQVLADRRDTPDLHRRTACHLTIADYLNHRLGGRPVIEVSMASTTQLMDVHTRTWSEAVFRAFGLDPAAWPAIVPSGTPTGHVTAAPHVAVLAACSHDTACAVAAVPAGEGPGWAYISCGTWSLLGVERQVPLLGEAARTAGFTNEAGLDGTIRFLKNLTGLWALQECAREWGTVDWEALEREARAAAPPAFLIDLEDPRFLPRGGMEARLAGYLREHGQPVPGTRAGWTRLILESIAAGYRRTLDDLERLTGQPIDTIHLVGGGARNHLLCALTAHACGRTVVAGPEEATALGNLLIQARTLGDLPPGLTLRDVARRSSDLHVFHPTEQTV